MMKAYLVNSHNAAHVFNVSEKLDNTELFHCSVRETATLDEVWNANPI